MSNYTKLTLRDDGTQLQILNNNCSNFDAGMENVIRILDDTLYQLSNYNGKYNISNDIEGIKTIKGKISEERDIISNIQTCYSKYYNGMLSADYEISNYIKLSNSSNDRYSIGLNISSNESISVKSLYEDFNINNVISEFSKAEQDGLLADAYEYIKTLDAVATDKDLMEWLNSTNITKNLENLITSNALELEKVYGIDTGIKALTQNKDNLNLDDFFGENAKYKGVLEKVFLALDLGIEGCKALEEAQEKGASMAGTVGVRTIGSLGSNLAGGAIIGKATTTGSAIGGTIGGVPGMLIGGFLGFTFGLYTSIKLEEEIINPIEDTIINDYLVKDVNEYDLKDINFGLKESWEMNPQGININLAYSPWTNPILYS